MKNQPSDEKLLTHMSFLSDLADRDSISKVASDRNISPEAVSYHLGILNDELGHVYTVRRGGRAELTDLGWEILAYYKPMHKKQTGLQSFIATQRALKRHAQCPKCFPESAKVFSGKDLFPRVKNLRRKLIIECLTCKTKVMVLLRSCVQKWLKSYDAHINGPHPVFRIYIVDDHPDLLLP
jgi:molybdenum-dependent DNA-binding transcriptional regulator ModE